MLPPICVPFPLQNATQELEKLEQAFDRVKRQLFTQLHNRLREQLGLGGGAASSSGGGGAGSWRSSGASATSSTPSGPNGQNGSPARGDGLARAAAAELPAPAAAEAATAIPAPEPVAAAAEAVPAAECNGSEPPQASALPVRRPSRARSQPGREKPWRWS